MYELMITEISNLVQQQLILLEFFVILFWLDLFISHLGMLFYSFYYEMECLLFNWLFDCEIEKLNETNQAECCVISFN